MKATEARKLAESLPNSPDVQRRLKTILEKIADSAKNGYFSLTLPYMSSRVELAVCQELKSLGYQVKHDSDQREGKSWTSICW